MPNTIFYTVQKVSHFCNFYFKLITFSSFIIYKSFSTTRFSLHSVFLNDWCHLVLFILQPILYHIKIFFTLVECKMIISKILFKVIHLDTYPLTTTTHAKIERKGSSGCWWFCFNDIFSKCETSYNLCWQLLLWVLPETRHALKPVSHKYEYTFMF